MRQAREGERDRKREGESSREAEREERGRIELDLCFDRQLIWQAVKFADSVDSLPSFFAAKTSMLITANFCIISV